LEWLNLWNKLKSNNIMEQENFRHESFGQIMFTRTNGLASFYGSELEQQNYISMELHQSEIQRDITCDRYYNYGAPLVRIRMSAGQFSELITSLNVGGGACCTIERLMGKKVAELPTAESRKEFVHRKFEDRMKEFADKLKNKQSRAKEISSKKTLSKADQEELNMTVEWLTQEVARNIPFFAMCFKETMDEVVFEAKLEVENAIQHKISVLGLSELHKQNELLSGNE
jgi:Glu-tRNA(Gln) amidotransferase subunit E-like FAD-binding protein